MDECVMLFSWFMVHDTSVKTLQAGVFRANCVDSLDRTNVVQSMLAERVLHDQFVVSLDVFSLDLRRVPQCSEVGISEFVFPSSEF